MKDAFGVERVSKGLPSVARASDGYSYTGGMKTREGASYIMRRGKGHDEGRDAAREMSGLSDERKAAVRAKGQDFHAPYEDFMEPKRTPTGRVPKHQGMVKVEPAVQRKMQRAVSRMQEGRWSKYGFHRPKPNTEAATRAVGYRNSIEEPALLRAARKIKIRRIP